MQAALYRRLGGPEVLEVTELPEPHPGPGEVRVRVIVSGVNPTDVKSRQAAPGKVMPFPFVIPHQDGAGVIDEVGEGVDSRRVGERVFVYFAQWQRPHGTAAQWTCLPAERALALPEGASMELGASLGIPALTAAAALRRARVREGARVLVAGGAGAVGRATIQLARLLGARVATTVSSEHKAAIAEVAGAEFIVNYRVDDPADALRSWAPGGVDAVIEVDPRNVATDLGLLRPHGAIVLYASGTADTPMPVRAAMVANARLEGLMVYTLTPLELARSLELVRTALAAQVLTPLPFHRFELAEVAAAHQAVEEHAVGKVIIDVAPPGSW